MLNVNLAILSFFVLIDFAYGGQGYTRSSDIVCGNSKITIRTECNNDSYRPFPLCQRQTLSFFDRKTGNIIIAHSSTSADSSGDRNSDRYIKRLITAWNCVSTSEGFLILELTTGGNCSNCESFSIYTGGGELLTPQNASKKTANLIAEKLGLNSRYFGELKEIPLSREGKLTIKERKALND